jgi:hypothetical protein
VASEKWKGVMSKFVSGLHFSWSPKLLSPSSPSLDAQKGYVTKIEFCHLLSSTRVPNVISLFFKPHALFSLDSSVLSSSTNWHHQIQYATTCLPYIKLPKMPSHYCLPKHTVTFLMKGLNIVLHRQDFPPVWKHLCGIHNEAEKVSHAVFFHRPTSLLGTIGKHFDKIILTRVFWEVKERGLLYDEQFRFQPRHSMILQLACIFERVAGTLMRGGKPVWFSWMWPKPLTLYGSKAF